MRQVTRNQNLWAAARLLGLALLAAPLLSACGGFKFADINNKTKFSSSEYGVAASRRLTTSRDVPKGGGRYQVGKPYRVAGKWYTPKEDPWYSRSGTASWYGPNFHGRETANGEIFDQYGISAAHPTLPLPSYVRVTNLENSRSIVVRVNDRGPYTHGREIDLSMRSAQLLGFQHKGTARVQVQYVGRAPLEGDDTRTLLASLEAPGGIDPSVGADVRTASAGPGGLVGAVAGAFGLLGYAPVEADVASGTIDSAFAATEAMAAASPDLEQWRQSVDDAARAVDVSLGVYRSTETINQVSSAFALLGAVQRDNLVVKGSEATLLRLTYLKPGVTRADVTRLAQELGLTDIILH